MTDSSTDAAMIQTIAERMQTQRLPRALSLKEKVDQGGKLNSVDIQFLKDVFRDAQHIMPLVERHPEWHEVAGKAIHLYKEITDKALENEKQ